MITLVLGGTRSGKSITAERIARSVEQPVTYVATAVVDPNDADHQARVAAHRSRRPKEWTTAECVRPADLGFLLRAIAGVALVDSLGTWVTLHPDLVVDPTDILDAVAHRHHPTILVSEEVGLAIHPATELGRRYVDAVGMLNQRIAEIADRVLLVVAGRSIEFPPSNGVAGPDPVEPGRGSDSESDLP